MELLFNLCSDERGGGVEKNICTAKTKKFQGCLRDLRYLCKFLIWKYLPCHKKSRHFFSVVFSYLKCGFIHSPPSPTSEIKVKNTPSKVRLQGDHFKFTYLKCLKFCQNFNLYVFRHARRDTSETHWRIRIIARFLRWIRGKQEQ